MRQHYHVLAGFFGCLPETNEAYETKKAARWAISDMAKELKDSGNTLNGKIYGVQYVYLTLEVKTTALCDYLEVSECRETDCLADNLDEYTIKAQAEIRAETEIDEPERD